MDYLLTKKVAASKLLFCSSYPYCISDFYSVSTLELILVSPAEVYDA